MAGSRARAAALILAMLGIAAACSERVEDLPPVGGEQASLAQQERYVRRLYLDLTGRPPTDAEMSAAIARLGEGGNTAATRKALAQEVMALDEFGATFVAELENRVFAGETPDSRFDLICGVIRANDPACAGCGAPPGGDPCDGCSCAPLIQLSDEQDGFAAAPADLNAGTATGEIERRYGGSLVLRTTFGDGGALTANVFETFLGRTAEADEVRNGRAMVQGSLLGPQNPAGKLFLQHGSSHADFVDIVFGSEQYRESIVDRTFLRFLGRNATPAEIAHFTRGMDLAAPDARPVIEAVVSSREYFGL